MGIPEERGVYLICSELKVHLACLLAICLSDIFAFFIIIQKQATPTPNTNNNNNNNKIYITL